MIINAFHAVLEAPLHYRALERENIIRLGPLKDFEQKIKLSESSKLELRWWLDNVKLDHEVSICSLISPGHCHQYIARTTKGNNSKGPGPMALIFLPTIQLVILVMCKKFHVSR